LDDDGRVLAVCLPADRPSRAPREQSARDGAPAVDERSETENDRPETPDADRAPRVPRRAQRDAADLVPIETFELCWIEFTPEVPALERVDRPVIVLDAHAFNGGWKIPIDSESLEPPRRTKTEPVAVEPAQDFNRAAGFFGRLLQAFKRRFVLDLRRKLFVELVINDGAWPEPPKLLP
jgi:hypothetical protein